MLKSDGSIYSTDPWTFRRPREQWEQSISGVFRISAALGTLDLASDQLFAEMRPDDREGIPDGMTVDSEGNVYCGSSGGIHILNPGVPVPVSGAK